MLVIVDGPARTGKTSACRLMVERLIANGVVAQYHKSIKLDNYFFYMAHDVVKLALDNSTIHILDRAHLSEIVYRLNDNSFTNETFYDMMAVDRVLASLGAIQIIIVADIDELVKRHIKTWRPFEGSIEQIKNMFVELADMTKIPTILVDSTDKTVEDVTLEIVEFVFSKMES